jgi:hypothetical protein
LTKDAPGTGRQVWRRTSSFAFLLDDTANAAHGARTHSPWSFELRYSYLIAPDSRPCYLVVTIEIAL